MKFLDCNMLCVIVDTASKMLLTLKYIVHLEYHKYLIVRLIIKAWENAYELHNRRADRK
jgi:hypothetical protein